MKLILVIVCLAFHLTVVSSVPMCTAAQKCNDQFVTNVRGVANDQDMYCIYVREKISCLRNTKGVCTDEQYEWVRNDIDTTERTDEECSSSNSARASVFAAIAFAFISYLFKH